MLNGIDRFEGRSSLKTWIFRILVNWAKTRGERESRTVPLSSLDGREDGEPAVDPDRFFDQHAAAPGAWSSLLRPGGTSPRSGSCRPRAEP